MKLEISKEQARILWVIINNQQAFNLKEMQRLIVNIYGNEELKEVLSQWAIEGAKEHIAIQSFKEELRKFLEGEQK
jgi:hypothetical protein